MKSCSMLNLNLKLTIYLSKLSNPALKPPNWLLRIASCDNNSILQGTKKIRSKFNYKKWHLSQINFFKVRKQPALLQKCNQRRMTNWWRMLASSKSRQAKFWIRLFCKEFKGIVNSKWKLIGKLKKSWMKSKSISRVSADYHPYCRRQTQKIFRSTRSSTKGMTTCWKTRSNWRWMLNTWKTWRQSLEVLRH